MIKLGYFFVYYIFTLCESVIHLWKYTVGLFDIQKHDNELKYK